MYGWCGEEITKCAMRWYGGFLWETCFFLTKVEGKWKEGGISDERDWAWWRKRLEALLPVNGSEVGSWARFGLKIYWLQGRFRVESVLDGSLSRFSKEEEANFDRILCK